MNFKPGQKIVAIKSAFHEDGVRIEKGKTYTYSGLSINFSTSVPIAYRHYIALAELPKSFGCDPNYFRPLLGDSAKSELINSFKEVTETSDCPIVQPETV